MKKLVVFGSGKIAEAVSYYFNRDSEFSIEAYLVDDEFATSDTFLEKPLIKLSEALERFSPEDYYVFVAVGYQGINSLREQKYQFFKRHSYRFASYVSPQVTGDFTTGDNTIIMDNVAIQPCVKFGNNVFVWGGAMIGHHALIEDHCWLTGGCLIGGIATIGEASFVGLGACIGNEILIGAKSMIGAATLATKSIKEKSVLLVSPTEPHRLNSDQFTRMSACFRV